MENVNRDTQPTMATATVARRGTVAAAPSAAWHPASGIAVKPCSRVEKAFDDLTTHRRPLEAPL